MAVRRSESDAVTLATGASGNSKFVNCEGASKVNIAVTCDITHQLTAGVVRLLMTDGKVVTITPAALPTGADATLVEVNAAGTVITIDLSSASNHRSITVRPMKGDGTSGPYGWGTALSGVRGVGLALTKAATAGDAIYTVKTTVYA